MTRQEGFIAVGVGIVTGATILFLVFSDSTATVLKPQLTDGTATVSSPEPAQSRISGEIDTVCGQLAATCVEECAGTNTCKMQCETVWQECIEGTAEISR